MVALLVSPLDLGTRGDHSSTRWFSHGLYINPVTASWLWVPTCVHALSWRRSDHSALASRNSSSPFAQLQRRCDKQNKTSWFLAPCFGRLPQLRKEASTDPQPIGPVRVGDLTHACPLLFLASDTIDRLEERQRAIIEPSEQAFVAKVRGVEHERAQAASHIQQQVEEAAARKREIERMKVCGSVDGLIARICRANSRMPLAASCC